MPYIPTHRRDISHGFQAEHCGELNYIITNTIIEYIEKHGLSYQTINDVTGVLAEVGNEFRERVVKPYEKMKRSGETDIDCYVRMDKTLQECGCEINP